MFYTNNTTQNNATQNNAKQNDAIMGLELCCEEISCYFSYSGVHNVRLDILKATLKYFEDHEEELLQYHKDNFINAEYYEDWENEEKKYIRECLIKTKKYLSSIIDNTDIFIIVNSPNYNKLNNTDNDVLKAFGMYGIIPIINHSDCEGYYTYGEAYDFMKVLEKTYMYYDQTYYHDQDVVLENHYLYPIFKKCIDTGKPIIFR